MREKENKPLAELLEFPLPDAFLLAPRRRRGRPHAHFVGRNLPRREFCPLKANLRSSSRLRASSIPFNYRAAVRSSFGCINNILWVLRRYPREHIIYGGVILSWGGGNELTRVLLVARYCVAIRFYRDGDLMSKREETRPEFRDRRRIFEPTTVGRAR